MSKPKIVKRVVDMSKATKKEHGMHQKAVYLKLKYRNMNIAEMSAEQYSEYTWANAVCTDIEERYSE